MPDDSYPTIIVYEIPTVEEIEELCRVVGVEALARAIAESIRGDLQFAREGDIIEAPVKVREELHSDL